jgi:leucyl aminopeptidase
MQYKIAKSASGGAKAVFEFEPSDKGKEGVVLSTEGKSGLVIFAGLGKKNEFKINKLRSASSSAILQAQQFEVHTISFLLEGLPGNPESLLSAAYEGARLTLHRFDGYKTDKKPQKLREILFVLPNAHKLDKSFSEMQKILDHVTAARDLVNEQATLATPAYVAGQAKKLGKGLCKITVFDRKGLTKLKAGGILAVGSASENSPYLVIMDYKPNRSKKTIALVGKGITFDSGGLSLKPAAYMETMKHDKSGAVIAMHTVLAAAKLNVPVRVVSVLALTENLISSTAYKPGDLVRTMSGKTIEVLNTDAEGRVVLADALHYAQRTYNPDVVIDLATLTGACVVALGPEAAGIMGNDEGLIKSLIESGEETYERLWQLPMWPEYAEYIKSDFADMKNVVSNGPGIGAGTITAAKFLENYINKGQKWAHLDIAGTSWMDADRGWRPKGASGFGVRLLINYLKKLSRN